MKAPNLKDSKANQSNLLQLTFNLASSPAAHFYFHGALVFWPEELVFGEKLFEHVADVSGSDVKTGAILPDFTDLT